MQVEDPETEAQKRIMGLFFKTIEQNGGKWKALFGGIQDKREVGKIRYPMPVLLFTGVLLFVCQLGARRQINHQLRGNERVRKKYRVLFGVEDIPHGDTLNYNYQRLKVEEVQESVCRLMERVMEQDEVRQQRLFGIYDRIAMDGTGVMTYHERHCATCLTRKLNNGQILYYHPVLEAKLVTPSGYALSLMTEFIENSDPTATKQDCELKAFYRLAERLKKRFPKAHFCLLLDGLFAGGPTLEVCQKKDWAYVIGLTDDDLPSVNQEFEALLALPPHHQREITLTKTVHQSYRWMNGIDYTDSENRTHLLNVLECTETTQDKQGHSSSTKFKWLTSFTLLATNLPSVANLAGRVRWKIENEGFNVQKNGGFALEHVFSHHEVAHKVFYLLLQIALIFFQLMTKAPSFSHAFPKGLGSLKNFAFRVLEAWRNLQLDDLAFRTLSSSCPDTS